MDSDWLLLPPKHWAKCNSYNKAAVFVKNCKVVNDLSERAIKLITDFASTLTKDEEQRQFILQVVEKHRKDVPDFTKESLLK